MEPEKTLTLSKPIQFGDTRYEVLHFGELQAKHLRGIKGEPTFTDFLDLVGASTGLLKAAVDMLSLKDAMAAVKIVTAFFTDGQETGEA